MVAMLCSLACLQDVWDEQIPSSVFVANFGQLRVRVHLHALGVYVACRTEVDKHFDGGI
uniref:Uncharacterized protein n=1 Tax=Anguilla anguilla TaxID=7936 RepID=A0A0E9WNC6_ANGAN